MVKNPQRRFHVHIWEQVPGFGRWSKGYEIDVYSFADETLEGARARGAEAAAGFSKHLHPVSPGVSEPRAHRVEIRLHCGVCQLSGIQPGCKRKPCEACAGRGTTLVLTGPDEVAMEALQEYLGRPLDAVELYQDPGVPTTWAVRAKLGGSPERVGFLLHNWDGSPSTAVGAIEEVEFKTWPPRQA